MEEWHIIFCAPSVNTLFPVEPVYPEGFTYLPQFITADEEAALCREIEQTVLHTFTFQGYEAKRKVASFGYDYSFDKGALLKGKDIPTFFLPVIERVAKQLARKADDFKELLITEYPPGSIITWHRDAPPFDLIAGISLLSDCTFRLRPYNKEEQTRAKIISLTAQRRSLYIMEGPSRSEWQHSITPVKNLRYSITLRTLKH